MTLPSGKLLPEVPGQLRLIAQFLIRPDSTPPGNIQAACEALAGLDGIFERLQAEFEELTKGQETLHWYSPHRLKGELTPQSRALAVGPAGLSEEDATRFFWLDGTTIRAAEQETNTDTMFRRMALARSWDMAEEYAETAAAWERAFYLALVRNLRQAPGHSDPAVNVLVRAVTDASEPPTLTAVLTAYLALGLNPAETLRYALRDLRIPETHHLGADQPWTESGPQE